MVFIRIVVCWRQCLTFFQPYPIRTLIQSPKLEIWTFSNLGINNTKFPRPGEENLHWCKLIPTTFSFPLVRNTFYYCQLMVTLWAELYVLHTFLLLLYGIEVVSFSSVLIISHTVGLLGWVISSSQGLYLNTGRHKYRINTYTYKTTMPFVGFEPMMPASERVKAVHALDRSATVIGYEQKMADINFYIT
jgi:hypothetical protein